MAKAAAEEDDRTVIYLGNRAAIETVEDPDAPPPQEGEAPKLIRRKIEGAPKKNCTIYHPPTDSTLMEMAVQVTDPTRGVWRNHSDAPSPAWVASNNAVLAQLLGSHYGCEVRDPEPTSAPDGSEG